MPQDLKFSRQRRLEEPVKLQESELSDYVWTEAGNAKQLLYWYNEREALGKLGQFSELL